jgi:hypothetical protein
MGLGYPLQLIASARSVDSGFNWPKPPTIERRWLAVVSAADQTTLGWRARTLKNALEGVGLRCTEGGDHNGHGQTSDSGHVDEPWRNISSDFIRQGSAEYCATLVLRRWPREVAPGWLGQALAGDLPVDVAIHVRPKDAQQVARMLKQQSSAQDDGGKDAGNALGKRDADVTRGRLIARLDRPVSVAVALTVRAASREQLRHRVETLKYEIGLALGDARPVTFEHDRGLIATQPRGVCDLIGAWRTLDCTSVASTGLFQPATINHANGAPIGTTHDGSMLVKLDPFDESLRSFGGLLTGSVGSGKSYFLKLLLRRLKGVELRIVEHSDPPEYDGVPDLLTFSVAGLSDLEKAAKLREYITDLWALARRDPRPRLLVLDELWSVLKRPELAAHVEEIARSGRKYGLALWIATQQIEELLANEWGRAVFDNASMRIYLQQEDRDLEGLCKAAHLSAPARRLLRGAARGQALIHVGRMLVFTDIQAEQAEHILVTTDPRDVWALDNRAARDDDANDAETGDARGNGNGGVLRRPDPVGDSRGDRRAVAAADR